MIIWRGLGIVVIVATIISVLLIQLVGNLIPGGYAQHQSWMFPLGILLAAAILWPLGRRLNGQTGRTLIDPKTGQKVMLRREHSLFFIKIEYWSLILITIAVVLFIQGVLA